MWQVDPNYKVCMAGLYFERPHVLLARVASDGAELPLLAFERGEDGILRIEANFLNREGDTIGQVRPGSQPVPSMLLAQEYSREKWRIIRRDNGALVCAVQRAWALDWVTLDVTFNMWIWGRPVKILPHSSNVPELVTGCRDPMRDCCVRFHQGVTIEES